MLRRSYLAAVAVAVALAAPAAAAPPAVQAPAYIVVSDVDGSVLAAHAAASRRAIASITKLMTVLVALEQAQLTDVVTVTSAAAGIGESTIFLRPGERLTVRDLAIGALVPSANDAATALAVHVGGGSTARFVTLMNRKARRLGLRDTHFANPHGLDQPGHYSSARDVVALLRTALRNPFIRRWSKAKVATIGGREVESTDALLGRLPQLAGKTGHTGDAGWSQVAAVQEGPVRIFAALLGSPSEEQRDSDLERLLRWALSRYRAVKAVDAGRSYAVATTGYGLPAVRLVAPATLVRRTRVDRPLVERVVAPTAVALPVRAGERLGEVRVYDGARLVARSLLVADRSVAQPSAVGKIRWYAGRAVRHLVGFVT